MFKDFTKKEFVESVFNSISILAVFYIFAVGFLSLF